MFGPRSPGGPPSSKYPVQFPPGLPTPTNLQAICLHGDRRPRYPDGYFPLSGFGQLRRRAAAVNRAESWFSMCCKGNETQEQEVTLCCVRQAVSSYGNFDLWFCSVCFWLLLGKLCHVVSWLTPVLFLKLHFWYCDIIVSWTQYCMSYHHWADQWAQLSIVLHPSQHIIFYQPKTEALHETFLTLHSSWYLHFLTKLRAFNGW